MEPLELVKEIVRDIDEKKGQDIKVLDIHEKTGIADYFIICTGANRPQTRAIADFIEVKVEERLNERVLRREGFQTGSWILLDYSTVVVQIFQPEDRAYYNLEKLWGDGQDIDIAQFLEG